MAQLADALMNCDEQLTFQLVKEQLEAGVSVDEIVKECNLGMAGLGQRFEEMDAFIPDLIFGGMLMKKVVELLGPTAANAEEDKTKKTFMIGTVQHDIHDIGKDITIMVFQGAGYKTIDLGVDVSPEKFVEAIREHKPDVVGMSLLLTTCFQSVFNTMEAINAAGLRDQVKICIGGAAAGPLLAEQAKCDFYGKTAVDGVRWANETA